MRTNQNILLQQESKRVNKAWIAMQKYRGALIINDPALMQ